MAQVVILVRSRKTSFRRAWLRRILDSIARPLKAWAVKYGTYLVESGYYSHNHFDWLD